MVTYKSHLCQINQTSGLSALQRDIHPRSVPIWHVIRYRWNRSSGISPIRNIYGHVHNPSITWQFTTIHECLRHYSRWGSPQEDSRFVWNDNPGADPWKTHAPATHVQWHTHGSGRYKNNKLCLLQPIISWVCLYFSKANFSPKYRDINQTNIHHGRL